MKTPLTLILDNHDSFTYNLYQYVGELGGNPIVKFNDEVTLEEIRALAPTHIILSPGPGRPEKRTDFGISGEVIENLGPTTPLVGVCLGHQGIIHQFGGKIVHAPQVMHGKKSLVEHDGRGLYRDIDSPIEVMRYHSLLADIATLPDCFEVTARTVSDEPESNGLIMGVRHKTYPIEGIQFHPESIGTPTGKQMLANFLT